MSGFEIDLDAMGVAADEVEVGAAAPRLVSGSGGGPAGAVVGEMLGRAAEAAQAASCAASRIADGIRDSADLYRRADDETRANLLRIAAEIVE